MGVVVLWFIQSNADGNSSIQMRRGQAVCFPLCSRCLFQQARITCEKKRIENNERANARISKIISEYPAHIIAPYMHQARQRLYTIKHGSPAHIRPLPDAGRCLCCPLGTCHAYREAEHSLGQRRHVWWRGLVRQPCWCGRHVHLPQHYQALE